ncbi:hypothetical protein NDU88_002042 [Pleurodeles waltl]|uniref:Uncharacterized protein n=1 Tax=Pleurodeles waltl TaxID=8319 RepID=A0AAV7U8V8_PLEWA|nr:hypothetical protein NDU88_002042 [Pleurodeles waltl]
MLLQRNSVKPRVGSRAPALRECVVHKPTYSGYFSHTLQHCARVVPTGDVCSMAGYDDPAEELYYMDDTAGSFDQDLVYALDAGVRHSVNQALVQAIQPIKHHRLGLVEQQAWAAPGSASTLEDPSFAAIPQPEKQLSNPHAADFQSLIRNMAREHDYNAGSHKKGKDVPPSSSSSSEPSSEQEDAPPRKRKKKAHHEEELLNQRTLFTPDPLFGYRPLRWRIMLKPISGMALIKIFVRD